MRFTRSSGLMAAAMIAALGAGVAAYGPPSRAQSNAAPPRPRRPVVIDDTSALDREIAEWNEAIDRRKAEKKAKRMAR